MNKSLLFLVIFLLTGYTTVLAQEITLNPYGISPRDVARDTVEFYFDRAYNGLLNVGKETKMFFKGEFEDSTLNNPVWTLFIKPAGSTADFGGTFNEDASTQLNTLIPDVVGTYKISFSDGTFADTLIINAALYWGVEGGIVNCVGCHNTSIWDFKYDKWLGTGHSNMLVRGLNGTLSSHYGEGCISCHTVGFDPDAANDGFDDFPFVFPDSLYPGVYDLTMAAYPEAMTRANIQCESCHGPGSEHLGLTSNSKISTSIISDNCAWCHDSGTHHYYPEQWDYSGHASGNHLYGDRSSCTPCHNGQGYIDAVNGDPQTVVEKIKITCATCHDPHDATNSHQLRFVDDNVLGNGIPTNRGGNGIMCMSCHKSRRNGVEYVEEYLDHLSSHYGPHHGPQADMLYAANTYTWGETLGTSAHLSAAEDACVNCHMGEAPVDEDGVARAGEHTFSMKFPDGSDNVTACEPCHGNIGEEFSDKKLFYNGSWADLDGNGTVEGLQIEIQGLLDQLAMLLPPVGSTDIDVIDSSWTLDQAAGLYNYDYVLEDRSLGVHNPVFAYELLVLSIEKNGGAVSVPDVDGNLPTEFSLAQNYPNPFNPSTTIEYSLPEQSNVRIVIYDALGNELDVLFDGMSSAGVHTLNLNAENYASGIYFYRMQANEFTQVRKMLLMK